MLSFKDGDRLFDPLVDVIRFNEELLDIVGCHRDSLVVAPLIAHCRAYFVFVRGVLQKLVGDYSLGRSRGRKEPASDEYSHV